MTSLVKLIKLMLCSQDKNTITYSMHLIQVWGILESYLCTYKDRYATLFTQLSLAGNSHTSLSVVSADIRCLPIKNVHSRDVKFRFKFRLVLNEKNKFTKP